MELVVAGEGAAILSCVEGTPFLFHFYFFKTSSSYILLNDLFKFQKALFIISLLPSFWR